MEAIRRRLELINLKILALVAAGSIPVLIVAYFLLSQTTFLIFSVILGLIGACVYWDLTRNE